MFLEVSEEERESRAVAITAVNQIKSNRHCDAARSLSAHDKQKSGDNAVLIATDKCDTEGRR